MWESTVRLVGDDEAAHRALTQLKKAIRSRVTETELPEGSSANALFRRAQVPANAERLCSNIWDGVTATRSTRRWLHRGRAFAVAPSSFALDIPHVAFSTGEQGICQRKAESSVSFSGARACARARAGVAWRRAAGGAAARVARVARVAGD